MNITKHLVPILLVIGLFLSATVVMAQKINKEDPFKWEIKPENVSKEFLDKWDYKNRKNLNKSQQDSTQSLGNSQKRVRIIYLVPSDKTVRSDYIEAIKNAILNVQSFYQSQLNNQSEFVLDQPIVQVVQSGHNSSWYSTNNPGNGVSFAGWYWENSTADALSLANGAFNDPNNRWLIYNDADQACVNQSQNSSQYLGALNGVALMPANDLRGLTGQTNVPPCGINPDNGGVNRWIGGLGHELGHTLGLPHPDGCDNGNCAEGSLAFNSLMYVGYAIYPNTYFIISHKNILLQSSFLYQPSGCQSGYSSIGGVITLQPTTNVLGNKVYVFARGTDGAVYYQTSTGGAFSGWQGLGGIINSNPASATDGTTLWVEGLGTTGLRYYQSTTGSTFSGWIQGSVTTQTNSSAVLNGANYNFARGTGSSPHLCLSITATTNPVNECPTGYSSLGGIITSDPTTTVLAGKVYVFARGTDGAVYYQTSTGGAFSGWQGLGGIINSNPASATDGTTLWVEGLGTTGLRYYQSTTGSTFSGWIQGSVTTQTNPSSILNGVTYNFVKGNSSSPPLCVLAQ
jgi:hypothetical protein